MKTRATPPGITAVLAIDEWQPELESVILDLAAVLDGLMADRFEIIVVEGAPNARTSDVLNTLRVRRPGLPLRLLEQRFADSSCALAAGFDAAAYDLIFAAAPDGQFDVRELNHLLEAIERGADLAIGYRVGRHDGLGQRLQGWTWNVLVNLLFGTIGRDVDCTFKLFRRVVWNTVAIRPRGSGATFCTELLIRARRLGFHVTEVPVSHYRPAVGAPHAASTTGALRRALGELKELRRDLELEETQPGREPPAGAAVSVGRWAA